MTTNEEKFCKMMGESINCWMPNYYLALDYVSDLVVTEKIVLDEYSDCTKLAKPFVTVEHDLDAVENLLSCFKMFAFEDSASVGDAMGIGIDDLDAVGLSLWEFIDLVQGDAKKSAELLVRAKRSFVATYSAGA